MNKIQMLEAMARVKKTSIGKEVEAKQETLSTMMIDHLIGEIKNQMNLVMGSVIQN